MYSVYNNNVFIVLMASSFSHFTKIFKIVKHCDNFKHTHSIHNRTSTQRTIDSTSVEKKTN